MNLNEQQRAAVESNHPRICIIAGPGSGKTRTLVERITRLLREGVSASDICAVTFTNAAARELEARINGQPVTAEDLRVPTDTALRRVVRLGYCGTLHGLMLRYVQQDAAPNKLAVADEEQTEAMLDESIRRFRYTGTKQDLRTVLARGPHGIGRAMTKAEVTAADFWQSMEEAGLIDYESILHRGLRLIQFGDANGHFEHLFVDETQDSGTMDAAIYEAMPVANKCFVGDYDQSIYGFRGGHPTYLISLARRPEFEKHCLVGNYRCARSVCEAANLLIGHNTERIPKQTISHTAREGTVMRTVFNDQPGEIAAIGAMLHKLTQQGSANDCAVLLRTNALADAFANAITAYGVPVKRRKAAEKPEGWRRALKLLAVCANPFNDWLMLDWLSGSAGTETAKSVKRLAAERLCSVNEALPTPWPECRSTAEFTERLTMEGFSLSVVELVEQAAAALPPDSTLTELRFALVDTDATEEQGDGVTVCTIHAAKGREWEAVFLPAFDEQTIPANRDVEEERRLAFVGITRAKNTLVITTAKQRPNPWRRRTEECQPSRFIAETQPQPENSLPSTVTEG